MLFASRRGPVLLGTSPVAIASRAAVETSNVVSHTDHGPLSLHLL